MGVGWGGGGHSLKWTSELERVCLGDFCFGAGVLGPQGSCQPGALMGSAHALAPLPVRR